MTKTHVWAIPEHIAEREEEVVGVPLAAVQRVAVVEALPLRVEELGVDAGAGAFPRYTTLLAGCQGGKK